MTSPAAQPKSSGHREALSTPLCALFGVKFPIVQTGMGWVSGARLTAATAEAGGMGILAATTMDYEGLVAAVGKVRGRTDQPFGVNLRVDHPDTDKIVELLIAEQIKLASFAGRPSRGIVDRLKDAGILTMPTVGARRHAEKMASWGVDVVIAQGGEGGGHTGSVPTSLLLPQVCEAVDIPVIGAGGFRDGAGLVAAMAWGATGIAMGTRFLLTRESQVPDAVKAQYLKTAVTGTVVTTAIDGRPQRVIRTDVVDGLESSSAMSRLARSVRHALSFRSLSATPLGALLMEARAMRRSQRLSWAQTAMAANAPMMTRAAMVEGRTDVGILPTGQVVGCIDELPTVAELLERIMNEADAVLARLGAE